MDWLDFLLNMAWAAAVGMIGGGIAIGLHGWLSCRGRQPARPCTRCGSYSCIGPVCRRDGELLDVRF